MDRTLHLMVGLPGQGMHLGIDPLSIFFLCLLAPQAVASGIASERKNPIFWFFVLAMILVLVAADAFALILGFGMMGAAAWLVVLSGDGKATSLSASVAIFSTACLIPAVFLPAGGTAFVLLVLGGGAQAGLAPLHSWLARAHPASSTGAAALMSGAMVKVALYIIIRYGFIVFGGVIAPWWGVALMVAGAASVLLGSLRAMLETELKILLACSTIQYTGLIAVGLGIGLRARAVDNPALASIALQAALLCALAHALFKPLLFLGIGAVHRATGATSLNWLGGLMRGMPRLGVLMLAGAAGMAALPLGPGFAPVFLLLHAVIAMAGSGGMVASIGSAALLLLLGLGGALALGSAVRIIGVGFLGRPRSLQAAAAEEANQWDLIGMSVLAGCCVPLALTPGLILTAMQPVIGQLVPGALPQPLVYAPLPLAALTLLPAAVAFLALRRWAPRGEREAPAWNGGLGKPPAWLPFGDPATQPSATGLAQPVHHLLASALLGSQTLDPGEHYILAPLARLHRRLSRTDNRLRRPNSRQWLALAFAALVMLLLALGLGQNL